MKEKIDETLVQLLNREISKPDAVEQLTAIACTNQSPNVNEALKAAVNAIYFRLCYSSVRGNIQSYRR